MEGNEASAPSPEASKPEPPKLEFASVSAFKAWIADRRSRGDFHFVLVRTHKAKPPRVGVSKGLTQQQQQNPNAVTCTATYRCPLWKNPEDFVSYRKLTQRGLAASAEGAPKDGAPPAPLQTPPPQEEGPPHPSNEGAPPPEGAPSHAPPCHHNEGGPQAEGQGGVEGAPLESASGVSPTAVGGGAPPCPSVKRALPEIEEEVLVLQSELQQLRRRLRYRKHELPPKHNKRRVVSAKVTGDLEAKAAALNAKLEKLRKERAACIKGPQILAALEGGVLAERKIYQQCEDDLLETDGGETSSSEASFLLETDKESSSGSSKEAESSGEEREEAAKRANPQEEKGAKQMRERNERAQRAARRAAARGDTEPSEASTHTPHSKATPAAAAAAAAAGGCRDLPAHCRRRLERMRHMRVVPHCNCPAELKVRYLVNGGVVVILTNPNHSDACMRNRQAPYKTPKEVMAYIARHSYLPLQTLRLCFEAPEVALHLVREAPPFSPYGLSDATIAYCLNKAHKQQGSSSSSRDQRRSAAAAAAAVAGWGFDLEDTEADLLPDAASEEAGHTEKAAEMQEKTSPSKPAAAARTAAAAAEAAAAADPKARGDEITAALQTLRCREGGPSLSTPKALQGPLPQGPPEEADEGRPTHRRGAPLEALSQRRRSPRLLKLLLPASSAGACSNNSSSSSSRRRSPSISSSKGMEEDLSFSESEESRVPSKRHLSGSPHKRGRARRGSGAPRGCQRGPRGRGGVASRGAPRGASSRRGPRGAPPGGSPVRVGAGRPSCEAPEAVGAQEVPEANEGGGPPSEGPPSTVGEGASPKAGAPNDAAWAALAAYFWRQARRLEEEEGLPPPHQPPGEERRPIPEGAPQGPHEGPLGAPLPVRISFPFGMRKQRELVTAAAAAAAATAVAAAAAATFEPLLESQLAAEAASCSKWLQELQKGPLRGLLQTIVPLRGPLGAPCGRPPERFVAGGPQWSIHCACSPNYLRYSYFVNKEVGAPSQAAEREARRPSCPGGRGP
ncbi:hypothetical protein Emed_006692 [Eimeria media]